MSTIAAVIGRILLGLLFVLAGISKIIAPAEAAQAMNAVNLPGQFAIGVGIFEVVAGLLLALGFMTRLVSVLLAGFTILATMFFHNQFGDPEQGQMALKNAAIVGGLLMVFAYGQMRGSYDYIRAQRKGEVVANDANDRARDAELRAARAEARADALAERPAPATTVVRDTDGDGMADTRTTGLTP